MAIKDARELIGDRIKIDLTGPDGNVFYLIGQAKMLARKLGLDGAAIQAEMMSSDYENAVQVFDSNFGEYVDLYK